MHSVTFVRAPGVAMGIVLPRLPSEDTAEGGTAGQQPPTATSSGQNRIPVPPALVAPNQRLVIRETGVEPFLTGTRLL